VVERQPAEFAGRKFDSQLQADLSRPIPVAAGEREGCGYCGLVMEP
jgi:hypothetical protein